LHGALHLPRVRRTATRDQRNALLAALDAPNIQQVIDDEVRKQTKAKVDAEIAPRLGKQLHSFPHMISGLHGFPL
jgi:hypothetical protein